MFQCEATADWFRLELLDSWGVQSLEALFFKMLRSPLFRYSLTSTAQFPKHNLNNPRRPSKQTLLSHWTGRRQAWDWDGLLWLVLLSSLFPWNTRHAERFAGGPHGASVGVLILAHWLPFYFKVEQQLPLMNNMIIYSHKSPVAWLGHLTQWIGAVLCPDFGRCLCIFLWVKVYHDIRSPLGMSVQEKESGYLATNQRLPGTPVTPLLLSCSLRRYCPGLDRSMTRESFETVRHHEI